MADPNSNPYWTYADPRQLNSAPAPTAALPLPDAKRPRIDMEAPAGNEMSKYYTSDDGRIVPRVIKDNDPIGASYDDYLRRTQMQAQAGNEPARQINGGMSGHHLADPRAAGIAVSDQRFAGTGVSDQRVANMGVSGQRFSGIGVSDPALASNNRGMIVGSSGGGGGRYEVALPPDASSTLFVEGLPADCTRREVAHIFRPFVGYKEVRLVTKESKRAGGDQLVLCFVDFISPAHAATAMDALEGYKFDEVDRDSFRLRLQFARNPGARAGGGRRGKR